MQHFLFFLFFMNELIPSSLTPTARPRLAAVLVSCSLFLAQGRPFHLEAMA